MCNAIYDELLIIVRSCLRRSLIRSTFIRKKKKKKKSIMLFESFKADMRSNTQLHVDDSDVAYIEEHRYCAVGNHEIESGPGCVFHVICRKIAGDLKKKKPFPFSEEKVKEQIYTRPNPRRHAQTGGLCKNQEGFLYYNYFHRKN